MGEVTKTSGIGLDGRGHFSLGAEAFFKGSFDSAALVKEVQTFTSIEFKEITASLRPPDPESSFFGRLKYFKTDGLFRIYVSTKEDPKHWGIPIASLILKSTTEPQNVSLASFRIEGLEPKQYLIAHLEVAGQPSSSSSNMELQAVGKLE